MADEYQGSNAYAGVAAFSFGTSVLSNYMQINAAEDKADALEYSASRYRFKAERSQLAAESARTQTLLNNTLLLEEFNNTQALQAVQFTAQGRTGATVANIIRQDQENLNWDREFMKSSGEIEALNLELDAQGYMQDAAATDMAAAKSVRTAYKQGAIGLLGAATTAALIV